MKGGMQMIISNSNVNMTSSRSYSKKDEYRTITKRSNLNSGAATISSITFSMELKQQEYYASKGYSASKEYLPSDNYNPYGQFVTKEAQESERDKSDFVNSPQSQINQVNSANNISDMYDSVSERLFKSLLDLINKLRFRGWANDNNYYNSLNNGNTDIHSNTLSLSNSANTTTWNVYTSSSHFTKESEVTTFSTTGTAVTADGRNLSFNLDMSMSREFMEYEECSYVTQYETLLTDPLVINLDSNPVSISDKFFEFDIDNDGEKENIPRMNTTSGYLALDKNNDGIINNGSELFGSQTGDGFGELAEYDSDNNGWIDESDEIYEKLKIWIKDEDGKDKLITLKEADIGAIYLGKSKTQFDIKDDMNSTVGRVRSSGIYLHEDGSAGTIQQVDF